MEPQFLQMRDWLKSRLLTPNDLILNERCIGVGRFTFPFLLVFSSQAIFAVLKYNMDWTKVTTGYFSSALLQISSPCQYLPGSRWAQIHRARFNMMHVAAKLVFFSKELKTTALSPRHTANGHFHVAALKVNKRFHSWQPIKTSWKNI